MGIKMRDLGTRLVVALSMKLRGLGAGLVQRLVDKSERLGGQAGPGPANRSEGFWGYGPRAGRPTLFGKPSALA